MSTTRHALPKTLRTVALCKSFWGSSSLAATTSFKGQSGRVYQDTGVPVTRWDWCKQPDSGGKKETLEEWGFDLRPLSVPGYRQLRHGSKKYTLKAISKDDVALRQRQIGGLKGSKRLHLPVDSIQKAEDGTDGLVYPHFNMTLDALIDLTPELRMEERIKIMRALAEGLHELHSRGRLHKQLSPHNVHMNISRDSDKEVVVLNVKLGGVDPAFLLGHDSEPPGPIGWEDWLSPEAQVQTGRNSAASDMFSLGLLFLHTLNGAHLYQIPRDRLAYDNSSETVTRQFILLGPVPEELLASIKYEYGDWPTWYRNMAKWADDFVKKFPGERFKALAEKNGIPEDATDLLMSMMNLAMSKRLTTEQVLEHGVWRGSWKVEDEQ